MSYRRRLMLLAALAVTLAVALASVATYVSVRAQLRDSVDDDLRSLGGSVATAAGAAGGPDAAAPSIPSSSAARFLLLLPASPLGEQAGYAQVVSSAGRIQPPPDQEPLLAAGPRVVAVAQGHAQPFFYDAELSRHAGARVRHPLRRGPGAAGRRARSRTSTPRCAG